MRLFSYVGNRIEIKIIIKYGHNLTDNIFQYHFVPVFSTTDVPPHAISVKIEAHLSEISLPLIMDECEPENPVLLNSAWWRHLEYSYCK